MSVYASSEGSDEPAHPRKIVSALFFGSNFDNVFLIDDGREDPNTTIGLPAKHHLNCVSLFHGPTWNADLIAL